MIDFFGAFCIAMAVHLIVPVGVKAFFGAVWLTILIFGLIKLIVRE